MIRISVILLSFFNVNNNTDHRHDADTSVTFSHSRPSLFFRIFCKSLLLLFFSLGSPFLQNHGGDCSLSLLLSSTRMSNDIFAFNTIECDPHTYIETHIDADRRRRCVLCVLFCYCCFFLRSFGPSWTTLGVHWINDWKNTHLILSIPLSITISLPLTSHFFPSSFPLWFLWLFWSTEVGFPHSREWGEKKRRREGMDGHLLHSI